LFFESFNNKKINMSFTWNELVCHGLLKNIGERGLVCRVIDLVRPMRRDFIEDEAREYHAGKICIMRCPVSGIWLQVIPNGGGTDLAQINKCLKKEFKDAWRQRDPACGAGRGPDRGRIITCAPWRRNKPATALWPSDICLLDVVKRDPNRGVGGGVRSAAFQSARAKKKLES
jgi:hypothetical protein